MKLLTKEIERKLKANFGKDDCVPVVKFFNPCGAATWLITDMAEDGDTLFGLCDLGVGEPELGYVSLRELQNVRLPFGLTIERDIHFKGKHPISVYADEARQRGAINA